MHIQSGVRSSIGAVSGRQTLPYRRRELYSAVPTPTLIQEADLSDLARANNDPPSQVIKEDVG